MVTSTGAAQRPVSSNKGDDDGPVGDLYSKIATGGFGLWISAVVVLGLSAGTISKTPASPLRSAASYNLTVVGEISRATERIPDIFHRLCWNSS
jgi:hypothetical protein